MKIAFCNRPSWNSPLGGDGVQMLSTKQCLEELYGVEVNIITSPDQLSKEFDIVHIFNFATFEITERFFEKAKQLGIPIAASTIYWDYSYGCTYVIRRVLGYPSCLTEGQLKFDKFLLKLLYFFNKPVHTSFLFRKKINKFVELSDILLPNSEEEANHMLYFAGLSNSKKARKKIHIVYNGVKTERPTTSSISKDEFLKKYSIPDHYILQVGRIEYVKNPINLVYALMDNKEIPIVFVGKPVDELYFKKLKELSEKRGNVFFINGVPHEEVSLFYKYADLHILLSLRESPGLVTLEAAQENCPIVVTSERFCPVKTYFPNCPYVVNPLDIDDIKNTVLTAYIEKKKTTIDFEKLSWEYAAKQTYEGYMKIINKQNLQDD